MGKRLMALGLTGLVGLGSFLIGCKEEVKYYYAGAKGFSCKARIFDEESTKFEIEVRQRDDKRAIIKGDDWRYPYRRTSLEWKGMDRWEVLEVIDACAEATNTPIFYE